MTNPGAATWSFDEEDLAALTRTVDQFLLDTGARSALIADRSGQLVGTMGQPLNFDPTVFATLTAADFSANDQLARLIGETDFTTLFHQGEKESMYVADVARRLILVTLFDNRTPIGLVRLKMKPVVEELTAHLDRAFTRARESGTTQPNILAGAGDEIDELFNW
jgi:predicted regulator of Ras-like GTPase activity (Roadblock/LC7/MglB family)